MTSDDIREDLAAAKDPSRQADALMALLRSVGPGGRPQPQYFAAVLEHCVIGVKDKQPGHKRLGYAFLRTCADGVADSEWSAMLDSAAADMHSKDPDVAAAALAAPLAAPRPSRSAWRLSPRRARCCVTAGRAFPLAPAPRSPTRSARFCAQ